MVPPIGWKARKDNYEKLDFVIPHPIEQIVTGKDGFYELFLLQRESRLLSKYEKLVESFDKITENKKPCDVEKQVSVIYVLFPIFIFFLSPIKVFFHNANF